MTGYEPHYAFQDPTPRRPSMTSSTPAPLRILGREPALILSLVASTIAVVSSFVVPLTQTQQAVLNAVVVAAVGVWTAAHLATDKLVPAILGAAQAVLSLALAFGLDLAPEKQSILLALVATVVAAIFVRPQVTAKVPPPGPAAEPVESPDPMGAA